ncbi:hypothetical protein [Sanguibacter gelidistatuariae]|nr:hypothetical protein [Sanguibacter gelidistatuariae]
MTTHTKRKSVSATAGVAVLLGALLAGCSGGASIEDFCADGQAIQDGAFLDDVDSTDTEAVNKAAADGLAQIKAIKAPKEIADDWSTLTDAMDEYLGALKDVDVTSDEGMEKMAEISKTMTSDEVTAASKSVETFISENCEA